MAVSSSSSSSSSSFPRFRTSGNMNKLAVSIAIVMAINVSVQVQPTSGATSSQTLRTYTRFVKTKCDAATYAQLCLKTLYPYASYIKTSPLNMCNAAIKAAIQGAKEASRMISNVAADKKLSRRDAAALKACVGEVKDAMSELKDTVAAMARLEDPGERAMQWANAKTWLSAASTDFETCRDELTGRGVTPAVRQSIRSALLNQEKLVTNALFLTNHLYG